jgi:hypothetical protein
VKKTVLINISEYDGNGNSLERMLLFIFPFQKARAIFLERRFVMEHAQSGCG